VELLAVGILALMAVVYLVDADFLAFAREQLAEREDV
jgi:hypothetical protein